jgi:hypothetical protein
MLKTFATEVIPNSNDPTWVSQTRPQGTVFELGKFVHRCNYTIRIEVFNKVKKGGLFSSEI